MGCVYQIKNKINGKSYIGQTDRSFEERKKEHEELSLRGATSFIVHAALKKYGIENFEWAILYEGVSGQELLECEIRAIKELGTKVPNGYNMTDGGEGTKGRIVSDETRKRMSEAHKGTKKHSKENKQLFRELREGKTYEEIYGEEKAQEIKEKQIKARTGRKCDEETKKKLSESLKGNPKLTEASKKNKHKRSAALKEYYKNNPMPEETRQKISESLKCTLLENKINAFVEQGNKLDLSEIFKGAVV